MFRPDVTEMVDWALKANDLATYLSLSEGPDDGGMQERVKNMNFVDAEMTCLHV